MDSVVFLSEQKAVGNDQLTERHVVTHPGGQSFCKEVDAGELIREARKQGGLLQA